MIGHGFHRKLSNMGLTRTLSIEDLVLEVEEKGCSHEDAKDAEEKNRYHKMLRRVSDTLLRAVIETEQFESSLNRIKAEEALERFKKNDSFFMRPVNEG